MGLFPLSDLDRWLEAVKRDEGYNIARNACHDWLDSMAEMADAGINVASIRSDLIHSMNRLNIALPPEDRPS